jgi:3-deoxy-manno-octulosonate cytidylyltransferase (CMP-KDO synthetase)
MPTSNNILCVIPARYGSSRFVGKPLALLADGRPMITHVLDKAMAVKSLAHIVVATDDQRIMTVVIEAGGNACMTRPDHPSGTDRIAEVVETLAQQGQHFDAVLNLQGDEPEMPVDALKGLINRFYQDTCQADIATLVCPLSLSTDTHLLTDVNVVKAVLTYDGRALYFSRLPVPYIRQGQDSNTVPMISPYYRHIGVYLYQTNSLQAFTQLPPSPLECCEQLEQLRALEAGMTIVTHALDQAPIGIDTPEDLARLLKRSKTINTH